MIAINQLIYRVLNENSELNTLLGDDKICVVSVPDNTINPVVQFARYITPDYGKTYTKDVVNMVMNIYTDSYSQCIDIAQKVRTILEGLKIQNDDATGISIRSLSIENIQENKLDDSFVQTLTFKIK